MRSHQLGLDVLQQADGSARLVAGLTDILVAVHGPGPVKGRQEQTDRATLQVSVESLSTAPSVHEAALGARLKQILDLVILAQLHPRTLISVVVQPVSLDGAAFATMLNACVAALIDAGIPMRTSAVAVSGCQRGDALVTDPTKAEEEEADVSWSFVFDAQKPTASPLWHEVTGQVTLEQVALLQQRCLEASQQVYARLKATVKQRLDLTS